MNKQLLSILSVVFSIVLALGIYLYFAQIEDKNIKPIYIVPDNAAIILESKNSSEDLRSLCDAAFIQNLLANEKIASFYQQLAFYDSLIKTNETMSDWFSNGQATYSFHTFNNKTLAFLMAVQTQKDVDPANVLAFFQMHFPNRFKITKRKFMSQELFDFTDFKEGDHFTLAFKSKLMLFSPDGSLVEMALLKIAKHSNEIIKEDKLSFVKNSGAGLNVYCNYKNLSNLIQSTCAEPYQNAFSILQNFAERAVYTISYNDEEVLLKGAAQTHETNFQYLDLLNSQAPIENNLRPILPDGIHFAYTIGYNGYSSFYKNVNEYLLNEKLYSPYKAYIDSLEKAVQMPFAEKLASKFGNHAALLAIDEPGLWKDSCYVTAIECADETGFRQLLQEMERAIQRKKDSDTTAQIVDSTSINTGIEKAYLGDAFKFYFTDLFEGMEARYYINYQGYYFFANNPQILSVLKNRWAAQKLLSKQANYNEFENKLSPNSNLEILVMNDHAPKFALNFLNNNWFSLINQNIGSYKRAQRMAIQFAGSNDKIFATQILIKFNISKPEKTEQVWAIPLDTCLMATPQVMYNYGLGTHVILAQDAKSQLYMIDREGKVLWKNKLDGKIISSIEELDLFNNGKRQWLFNTNHQIYLIDENGKNIAGWPVWIPTGTNYTVPVFDPNKDRNYQIFATGIYYKVSAYTSQGRLLPSWNPKEVFPNFKSSVGTFNYNGAQVYWALNEKGKINFLNTQAKVFDKIKIDSTLSFIDVKITSIDTGAFLVTAIDSNQLYQIYYSSSKPIQTKTFAAPYFNHVQSISNGINKNATLLYSNSHVEIRDENGKQLLNRNIQLAVDTKPQWLLVGNTYELVYTDPSNNLKIENEKSEAYKPFPMQVYGPYAFGNLFNEADNWLLFSDGTYKLNLYRIK